MIETPIREIPSRKESSNSDTGTAHSQHHPFVSSILCISDSLYIFVFVGVVFLNLQLYISRPHYGKLHPCSCCRFRRPLTAPLTASQQHYTSSLGAAFTRQQNMLKVHAPSICRGGSCHSFLWKRLNFFLMYLPWLWVRLSTKHQTSERRYKKYTCTLAA